MGAERHDYAEPAYDLDEIKRTVTSKGRRAFTGSSLAGIAELGMTTDEAIDCIVNLTHEDFYKTMPALKDPSHFQDVYHGNSWNEVIYIKFTGYSDRPVVISFKEK